MNPMIPAVAITTALVFIIFLVYHFWSKRQEEKLRRGLEASYHTTNTLLQRLVELDKTRRESSPPRVATGSYGRSGSASSHDDSNDLLNPLNPLSPLSPIGIYSHQPQHSVTMSDVSSPAPSVDTHRNHSHVDHCDPTPSYSHSSWSSHDTSSSYSHDTSSSTDFSGGGGSHW